jgi:hypothetical protein
MLGFAECKESLKESLRKRLDIGGDFEFAGERVSLNVTFDLLI